MTEPDKLRGLLQEAGWVCIYGTWEPSAELAHSAELPSICVSVVSPHRISVSLWLGLKGQYEGTAANFATADEAMAYIVTLRLEHGI